MDFTIQQAADFLIAADDILILCHRNPDGDTLGSAYGLYYALVNMGKRVAVLCHDQAPPKLVPLMRQYRQTAFSPKAVVSVDIADEQLFGDTLAPYRGKVDLAIDHHPSHTYFAAHTCLESDSSATCEVAYLIVKAMGSPITPLIAECFYTGIATDTGCFVFSSTTPRTHRLAAELIEAGCPFAQINRLIFETKSMQLIELERQALAGLEFHAGGQIAVLTITLEMLKSSGISEAELDGISGIPRKIEGVEVGITIKERDANCYKISMRTCEKVNASALCQSFGGGGHKRAAGCTINASLPQAKNDILTAVQAVL